MNRLSYIGRMAALPFALLLSIVFSVFNLPMKTHAQEQPVLKASFARDASQIINIDLVVGQSRVIELDEGVDAIQFSEEKIVKATALTGRTIVINAVGIGQAQVAVAKKLTLPNQPEQTLVFRVFVQKDLSLLDNQIKILYPKENIQLSQVNDSVVISGSVTHPDIAKGVTDILTKAKVDYTNLLKVPTLTTQQVMMEVRIAEVNRRAIREVGTAFGVMNRTIPTYISPNGPAGVNVTGGLGTSSLSTFGTSAMNIFLGRPDLTSAFIRALQERGAIRSLAEPNIIAAHGQKGQFLQGGKIPIPQVTSASTGQSGFTITYQEYGVMLEFTPTIKDESHITIQLKTEVSNIDRANGITTNAITVPALSVNTASTMLELADGQSFALAGLINNRESVATSQIPGIGSIPILGELFKSRSFERNESELMFLCTVRIVQPLNPDQIPRLPGAPPGNTNLPTKPNGESGGAAFAPVINTVPTGLSLPASNVLEGESGHAVPRKVVKKSDN